MGKRVMGMSVATVGVVLILIIFNLISPTARTSVRGAIAPISLNPFAINKEVLANQLGASIRNNEFPQTYQFNVGGATRSAKVQYTLQETMQSQMKKLLG